MKKTNKPSKKKKIKNPPPNMINSNNNIPLNNQTILYSNNPNSYQGQQQVQIVSPEYIPNQIPPQGNNMYPQNQMNYQSIPIPQNPGINYEQISNVNQVNHQNIYQTDSGSLYLSLGCCFKIFPIIFFVLGLGLIPLFTVVKGNNGYIVTAIGVVFILVSLYMMFRGYYTVYFYMGINDLTVTKKALCGKNTVVYGPGELISIELSHDVTHRRKKGKKRNMHNYQLDIETTNNGVNTVFRVGQSTKLFTDEEIGYFNYIINLHIQTKMRIY